MASGSAPVYPPPRQIPSRNRSTMSTQNDAIPMVV